MSRWLVTAAALVFSPLPAAQPWTFSDPLAVTRVHGERIFHHLESAGRKNIAVSAGRAAVVWEDNRSGAAAVYLAVREGGADFQETRLSGSHPAYEPAIAPLPNGGFVAVWEEDARVWAQVVRPGGLGPPAQLSEGEAKQPSVATAPSGEIYLAWAERQGRFHAVRFARASVDAEGTLSIQESHGVDVAPLVDEQLYPSLAAAGGGVVVAWEDRRFGHTRLLYVHSSGGPVIGLPRLLNEQPPARSTVYGRGSGVARVSLARIDGRRVAGVWSDKREFLSGYGVYAAFSEDGGRRFGANMKVHDAFGDAYPQWHPAVAGHPSGGVVAAWDDERDNTPDIWISWHREGEWSEDLALPGASGVGVQVHPAVALDRDGNLHAVWLERDALDAPTRLRYVHGRLDSEELRE